MTTDKPVNRIKTSSEKRSENMLYAFIVFYFFNLLACIIMGLMTDGGSVSASLFGLNRWSDQFMDFFNSIRDSNQPNIYTERHSIYPPLAALLFRLIGTMVNQNLVNTKFSARKSLYYDQRSMMIYFLFVIVCLLLMSRMIDYRMKHLKSKVFARIIGITLTFTFPVIYCVERGNIVLLCVVCSMFFFFFRNSENKAIRELAYFNLAMAAGLKLYPAVFGVILLIEKKYKDALRLVLYGFICIGIPLAYIYMHDAGILKSLVSMCVDNMRVMTLAVSPFSARTLPASILSRKNLTSGTGVMQNIGYIILNIKHFFLKKIGGLSFSSVSVQNFVYFPGIRKILSDKEGTTTALLFLTEVVAAFNLFLTKSEWKRTFLLCYLMLNIPAASSSYSVSFITIPFVLFLCETKSVRRRDWISLGLFSFILTPLPVWWYFFYVQIRDWCYENKISYDISLNKITGFMFFQFMFLFIVLINAVDIAVTLRKAAKDKTYEIRDFDETETDISPVLPAADADKLRYSMYEIDDPFTLLTPYAEQQKQVRLEKEKNKKAERRKAAAEALRRRREAKLGDAKKDYNYSVTDWSSDNGSEET